MTGRLRVRATVLALALTALSGCASGQAHSGAGGNPLAGVTYFTDPAGPAARAVSELRAGGRAAEAEALQRIASQPTAEWIAGGPGVEAEARSFTTRATAAGRVALLVAYDIPQRDCSGYSAGGASSGAEYRTFINRFAAGIGSRRTTVILEPDAIAQTLSHCLSAAAVAERYALLSYAVGQLRSHRATTVYLDAGNPGWIQPAARLAGPLRRAGVARANGFALNVSNFYGTEATASYGRALSRALGGAHFVIDTGRNGNGADQRAADGPPWCNPPGRALGHVPSTATDKPLVDAYLWVKQPGDSDGSCRPGAPSAGTWWPQYALELARNSG
jgi:endoglucanase